MSTTTLFFVSILTILPSAIVPAELSHYYEVNVEKAYHQFLATYRINFTRICPEKSAGFNESLSSYAECLADTDTTLCDISDSSLENCTIPFIKFLEECLPEESKHVPSLLLRSHLIGTRFLCENSVYLPEMRNPCMAPKRTSSFPCKQKTDEKLKAFEESPPNFYDVCKFIIQVGKCMPKLAEQYCPNDATKEAFEGLWKAFATPCKPF